MKNKAKDMFRGATAGCALDACRKTFHYYCAHEDEQTITKKMVVKSKSTERNAVLYRYHKD